ncbi:MAG: hypothetical protein NT154_20095, partial [Verrucomicrobia bacterium]|nr:hypothetical protein [Verrucomicrobiota bacterium]
MRIGKLSLITSLACTLLLAALGTPAQAAESSAKKTIVCILADNEYRAWQTVPEFGRILEEKYGFNCEYLTSSTDGADPNRFFIPRMEKVKHADLVIVFARRRALPKDQMQILKDYLDSGKPLLGIRTASHAFDANLVVPKEGGAPVAANLKLPEGLDQWPRFDKEVFGCSYHGHFGAG